MSPTNSNTLCEKYPLIFADQYTDPTSTLTHWGFECGDGWFHIIDCLCLNIQSHINWGVQEHNRAVQYNTMISDAKTGNWSTFDEYYKHVEGKYRDKYKEITLSAEVRPILDPVSQVVAVQIKEKFGTLRFYYNGGDETIQGMVRMAESMSAVTCETCGSPGKLRRGGWLQTLCDRHQEEYQKTQHEFDE